MTAAAGETQKQCTSFLKSFSRRQTRKQCMLALPLYLCVGVSCMLSSDYQLHCLQAAAMIWLMCLGCPRRIASGQTARHLSMMCSSGCRNTYAAVTGACCLDTLQVEDFLSFRQPSAVVMAYGVTSAGKTFTMQVSAI